MHEGLKKLYTSDFNVMEQIEQADGSVVITLIKRGEDKCYRFRVKNLYGEHEEVLDYDEIPARPPAHVEKRIREAREMKAREEYE